MATAGLLFTATGVTAARADITGETVVGLTGTGLIVDPKVVGGSSSIQICATADLYGNGPLLTGLALAGEGAENYATSKAQQIVLKGTDTGLDQVGQKHAAACTNVVGLHPTASSTYAVEFELVAHGTLTLGGVFTATCLGTVVRAVSGPVITINPCSIS